MEQNHTIVMAGLGRLGPAIHALKRRANDVDARDKPGQARA
jgi:hypothetical protein